MSYLPLTVATILMEPAKDNTETPEVVIHTMPLSVRQMSYVRMKAYDCADQMKSYMATVVVLDVGLVFTILG